MKIDIITFRTALGQMDTPTSDKMNFLNKTQKKELDTIGYSGKNSKGKKMGRVEYLNSLSKGNFEMKQTRFDNGEFIEEFELVRVH